MQTAPSVKTANIMKIKFLLTSVLFFWSSIYAQIPGFIEKWSVDLGSTNLAFIRSVGRDCSVLVSSGDTYDWLSPTGVVIGKTPSGEFLPTGTSNGLDSFVVVLLLQSNLVVQSSSPYAFGQYPQQPEPMQITQLSPSAGGTLQINKTQFIATVVPNEYTITVSLSDFSCPERLMFVQQGTVLTCYRPAADIPNALTALTLNSLAPGSAQLLVTSSQGGQLQVQGSTNLTNWQPLTNIHTVPGVTGVVVPALDKSRYFYRGVSQ